MRFWIRWIVFLAVPVLDFSTITDLRTIYGRSPAVWHENLGDEHVARIGWQFKGLPAISTPVISYWDNRSLAKYGISRCP